MVEAKKYIYDFSEGSADMRTLLGGKGANLAQMWKIGLPVPPGFIITTEACHKYWEEKDFISSIWSDVEAAVARVEELAGKKFGSSQNPLLVSVRSGAPVSMPGMMDTILNLGLNDDTVAALAKSAGDERFAYDSYRRFIQMFSDVVLEVDLDKFEERLAQARENAGVKEDYKIPAEELKKLVVDYKKIVEEAGHTFPSDPWVQLRLAIDAVFRSWNTPRAITYRKINNIPAEYGTAVNIVTMVFGNLGDDCGTGVCFTRSPSNGENKLFGEYLINAQGEDVVAGIRTPVPIASLEAAMPEVYKEFHRIAKLLETHYRDAQDIEFTVERGKLYILQTRNGKRTASAAVRIAMDMLHEGLIDAETAVSRVAPEQVEQLLHPQIDPKAKRNVIVKGLPASPGAAVGRVVFDADEAAERGGKGEAVILVRPETTPDDIHGLFAAQGVLTSHGGMTSHAAVVARGLGKPCVSGAESVKIDLAGGTFTVGGVTVKKDDFLTLDGTNGDVILGKMELIEPQFDENFRELLEDADKISNLQVWANADTPEDARRARSFGAKGIGLCRTEHMFMAAERLPVMQEMVVSTTTEERVAQLKKLEVMQEEDFLGIFEAMEGLPVTVRLLDPPLHEFLPKIPELTKALEGLAPESAEAKKINATIARARELHEQNPMLGFRGCRLGMIFPEIYEMQARAIFNAACKLTKKGVRVIPDIMIPLVGTQEEMKRMRKLVDEIGAAVIKENGVALEYMVGTMIELPRAAMVADQLAEYAQFFSFGTNDLTQTTFGYSRDDAEGKFLGQYVEMGVFEENPFARLDRDGVGALMEIAVGKGRSVRPEIQLGICGEHGGNPSSIAFCNKLGLNYVSCSPFRVPVARLSAALAALGVLK
ncbi:pyruvate, phosphate dikinase [Cloacibacillus porcorum]|uniref:Pyruvate, phosphate dikinase n=1 Tax=Cloacibacillus porcorum TaxID=1197717 RepID=A0A1B2I4C7_9BACT|nr:pyruvate, phosphate dikinase [Cloacibacillus porcorum]ANZ44816.1 pyruvate, phosphate dikinase [Cloacibacillus porcorum]MCC8185176.1 pyruvate, phosphate dikinase [Cloacibacillus porcorum]MCI5865927.1 pyruvate, phosphate dikinase [Cloacibacillus porcorum]MDD7648455.1 pyruvate, phosphate dikinase [Cloacibacillus porcorum]MDY4093716.1 pyruvate, phosphate dikinase [Cloacibacillus porcorum]